MTECDAFAQSITLAGQFSDLALRDHAKQILWAIALDIETYQSSKEQIEKSQVLALVPNVDSTAASIHRALRQENDFSLVQLSAELDILSSVFDIRRVQVMRNPRKVLRIDHPDIAGDPGGKYPQKRAMRRSSD
ncbi:hypothetical protein SBC1_79750 (plasmid) [Caballeronia sp. SBC1]|uniref:hypothetical protein n=1 Tax=Caballeronia sp. SBC1 TaxID=2705548 RepID=UPI00140EB2A7|nr:hypothetical protein [Caballeronia sp. SBC1]QIN67928.1 hypothetical protein SBC1_79750 [Caballeronia sp. SBC1]